MDKLVIIGASGHGKVVADIALLCGYKEICFLDDDKDIKECAGWPVVGNSNTTIEGDIFVAIGNASIRKRISQNRRLVTLIHPNATVSRCVEIGEGSVVMAGVVINPGTKIGKGCILNTSSSIDHDCNIGDFCHVSVGTHLCGTVSVGNGTWIGAGSTVINNISICGGCLIGAGSVVIQDLNQPGTYVGVPAKKIKMSDCENCKS